MNSTENIIRGKVYVVTDNIDTDQIIPAKYLNLVPTIPEEYRELGRYALSGLPNTYPPFVQQGNYKSDYSILIAGRNFGCGSSREHAPIALSSAGVRAVLSESYARIFFRNAVATGALYPFESITRLVDEFQTGDEAEITINAGTIVNIRTGNTFNLKPLGDVAPVIQSGGLFKYARSVGMISKHADFTAHKASIEISGDIVPTRTTRIIAVANQKGGVGKTTTVVNLSACLADMGLKVLVVDMDPQANATSGLGIRANSGDGVYQCLIGAKQMEELIQATKITGLDIVPSEINLAGIEAELVELEDSAKKFTEAIQPVRSSVKYDFIFVDCPPSLGILTVNALSGADSALIPIQCEYYALEGLSLMIQLLERLKESNINPRIEVEGIIMTMFDARTNLSTEVVSEVRKHFSNSVYKAVIPRSVRISESPSHGLPVVHYAKDSSGAKAYHVFAQEFLERISRRSG